MSTTAQTASAANVPVDPATLRERVFILFYHYRASAPQQRVFNHKGDLPTAIERGSEHCKKMGYRFIKVRPFIVDLDSIEKSREDSNWHDDL